MKKTIIYAAIGFVLIGSTMTSCSKYEEGSKFTVLTKKARVVGDWTVASVESGGVTTQVTSMTISFKKDGSTVETIGSTSVTGKWDFNSDKDFIVMTDSQGTSTSLKIIELKNKEMKLQDIQTPVMTYKLTQ